MQSIPTIGLISTWPVYQGTTIDRYAQTLLQGINAAAHASGCHLLLGCGFSITGKTPQRRNFWPVPGPDVDFVPVGPWNTDGLIIVPDELSESQMAYVHDLLASGFPVIFTTPEGPGPLVSVDNVQGIREAFFHLYHGHGHRKIAFIAGNIGGGGDSEERLHAYHTALNDAGIAYDERLVAFGKHREEDGAIAMEQILATGAAFTAVMASNDLSCLGAIEALTRHGYHIPQDVAVMGFDDILDARACTPSLSTVRHPTFSLGYQSVVTLLEYIRKERKGHARVVVSPRLIIRQSCGCRPEQPDYQQQAKTLDELAHEMALASIGEARTSMLPDLEEQSRILLNAMAESLKKISIYPVLTAIDQVLAWTEERGEDVHVWQAGTAILLQRMNTMVSLAPDVEATFVASLIDRVRLEISDQIQRQTTRSMIGYMDMMAQLGQLTAELLSAMSIEQSAEILTRHLPEVGIKNALVALYENGNEDPTAQGKVLFGAGFQENYSGLVFEPRKFPIPAIYELDQPQQLTILPLEVDENTSGFVAFNAPNPELCAAIVHNLGAALRTSQLVQEAIEGRRLAEEANRLKSRFLSMVSHELRTPLSLIIGLSEMSLRGKGIDVRDIEQINTSAQHLARLIGDVLDLASNEAGQLRILREPLDLAEVLGIAAKIGGELAREKGLEWQVELPSHGPWVLGDRTRLRQVMLNLISNAVKFTESGTVSFSMMSRDGVVQISVSDTGLGIAPAELDTIFDEFYRSERTVETGIGGMGLGLVITRQLVEKHNGQINVSSPGEFGCGSTFTITLPVLSSATREQDIAAALPLGESSIVLLIESGDGVDQVRAHLTNRGFKVHVCQLDQEANWLTKVTRLQPAALILGERLAAREGWSIAGILRRQTATENIPVLAYALAKDKQHGELLELNYLHKPLQPEELSRELLNVLPPSKEQQTVLIVDDDPGILEMHTRLVLQTARNTITARNGKEALDAVYKSMPDLILLDLMMPEMDGFEVLAELRKRESTRDIPVIILTARLLSDADLERCNFGVASILSKGVFSDQETLAHIDAALERRSALGSATRHLVRRAVAFIHTHYMENFSRDSIAEYVGISSDYLTDCFRQELGITPIAYIRRYRIHQACELLKNSNQSITQIAMNVGFSDSAHFTRTFLREMESTPKAYRRKHQL